MSSAPPSLLYLGERDTESGAIPVGQGVASVIAHQSPMRASGSQDAAAVIGVGDDAAVLAVADGVGGLPGGADAANLAVRSLQEALTAAGEATKLRTAIIDGIEHANHAVMELGTGAATTLAVAEIRGTTVRPYHVGDSTIMVTGQRGRLKMQTIPHSPVGFAVEAGLIDAQDAIYHTDLHYISNVIGTSEMRIEVGAAFELAVRDTLILATDGLLDNLRLEEIVEAARKGPIARATRQLAEQAGKRMRTQAAGEPSKPDDLTCILFRLKAQRRASRGGGGG